MKHIATRRGLRAALVALVGGALLLGGATAAHAAPVIDPDAKGSISIHKLKNPNTAANLPANGAPQNVASLEPLGGVAFTIAQVDPAKYDLKKNTGWDALKSLTVETATNLQNQQTKTTTGAGLAEFSTLPLGVYLVKETAAPAGVTPAAPFLITVPLTNPTDTTKWMYDVHVYPKNAVITASKSVSDTDAVKVGDTVSWTILGAIPNLPTIDGYKITDTLPPALMHKSTTVSLDSGTTTLLPADYTVTPDGEQNVSVQFTPAGLAKLAAHNTANVKVVIITTVKTVGEISNSANVYSNAASFAIAPGAPGGPLVTAPAVTKFGSVTLRKESSAAQSPLPGASFSVYLSESDARLGMNPVTIDGTSVWTTGPTGEITISGLRFSDFVNGAVVAEGAPGYQKYWLVETVAPTGHELRAEPIGFTVTKLAQTLTVTDAVSNGGFILPLTGGPGAFATYAVGAALLIGTGVLLFRRRRRTA